MEYIRKYIQVSFLGTITGISISAVTYSVVLTALQQAALGTDLFCNLVGEVFRIGTTYLCGDIAGNSVKLIVKHIGHSSKKTIDINSHIVAGAAALTAGTVATISVVIGEYIIYYGIQYGGKLSQDVIEQISVLAAKLTYKLSSNIDIHKKKPVSLSDDWVLIGPMSYNPFEIGIQGMENDFADNGSDNGSDSSSDGGNEFKDFDRNFEESFKLKLKSNYIPLDESLFPIILE